MVKFMATPPPFTPEDEAAIAEALNRAEEKTSGEIVVVVAIASDGYRSFGVLWAALIALAVPMPLIFATKWPVEYIYLVQLVVFFIFIVLFQLEGLRYALVPKSVRNALARISAPSSSSSCRTCTPPKAAPAC